MTPAAAPDHRDPSCLFCRIVSGEIPANVVMETAGDSGVVAFRDISPQAATHVLVIPKRHIVNAQTVEAGDGPVLAAMLATAREVAAADGLGESGYRLVFNVGPDSGNSVPHLHVHVLGGQPMGWPPFPG
jgi:histidine triad (HIT) family protein